MSTTCNKCAKWAELRRYEAEPADRPHNWLEIYRLRVDLGIMNITYGVKLYIDLLEKELKRVQSELLSSQDISKVSE